MIKTLMKYIFLNRLVWLGLGLVLLITFLSCGPSQFYSYSAESDCDEATFLSRLLVSKNSLFSYELAIISLTVLIIALRKKYIIQRFINILLTDRLIYLDITQLALRILYLLLEPFRRGILYPQIYSLSKFTN